MQTLEALLEKRIPDDYMKNYKKTYSSKVQSNTNKVRTESNECDQPMPNGDNLVANPNDTNSFVKTMPLTALSYNGVSGNGNLKLTANVLLSPERGHSYLQQGSVQIRSVGSNSRIVSNHQRKILPAINGVPTEEAIRLAVPSLTSDGRKKFKITTVPKVVPLINTVGNQSKLLPFQASEMGHNSILSVSPELKSAGKSSSILEARLSTRQVAGPASSSDSELNSMSKDNGVLESPESTELHASTTPSEKVSQSQGYMVQKNRKTTISFERGATRIVSTKAKNTQTVDIGVQVYMPEPDADIEGNTVCLSNQMPPLQPISTSTSGRATAISTMPTNEYVILNTKNGKRILTIPKQMTGTKTFVIDGKSTTISQPSNGYLTSTKSIFMSDSHLCQNKSNLSTAASLSCDTVTTPSSSGQLSIPSPLQVPSNNPVILSVATSTGASHNIQTVGALNYNQIISSDRLVLPLNSPVTFDGKLCSVDSTVDPAVSSQSSFQFNTHNSDSIVLPLNSPIKPSSISRLNSNDVHTIPNTTSLFILVPNEQATSNNIEHETSEDISDKINVLKRKVNGLKNEILLSKKRCLELSKTSRGACEAPTREGIQQHPHGPAHISPDNAVNANSKVSSAPISKEDINISVKNAFSEFRNCLIADKDGKLPIHSAVENNDIIAVRRQCILLRARRSSVDVVTSKEETPLQLALYHGHSSIAAILLQHGADASVIDQEGNTALHLAVMYAEEVFESLLLPGQSPEAFVNNLNDEGFSALHLAAQCDKVTAIKWLLNHGAIVDLPDGKCGRTALFIAIERKSYRAQKALLACGADMREPTFSGSTPFLLTKADTIAHLTSGQDAVAEFIDSDALLRSSSLPEDN